MSIPNVQDHAGLLLRVQTEWNKAESAIKVAETVSHDVIVPSINDLRNAGRNIVDSLQLLSAAQEDPQIETLLREAIFDCQSARYDAIDAETAVISLNIDVLIESVGYESLVSYTPEFREFFDKLQDIRKRIATAREGQSERGAIYSTIEETDLPELLNKYERLRSLEKVLQGIAKKRRWELVISRVTGVIGIIVGLLGLVSAFLIH